MNALTLQESNVFDPGSKLEEKKQRIHSWCGKDFLYYQTKGFDYCSCNSFKHGNGARCKHLVAKSCRPQVKIMNSNTSAKHFAGVYLYLGTFKFPVWVLDLQDGGSVYMYKSKTSHRWMITEYYDSIFSDKGLIRTKNRYARTSLYPPLDCATEWQLWSSEEERWVTRNWICVV
jgi:hypothetical protein